MEIYWQAAIANPGSPVFDYLVKAKEKGESDNWKNCTEVQTSGNYLKCVVNDLRSETVYIVQVAARNVVGYSVFTETEAQTTKPAGSSSFVAFVTTDECLYIPALTLFCVIGRCSGFAEKFFKSGIFLLYLPTQSLLLCFIMTMLSSLMLCII